MKLATLTLQRFSGAPDITLSFLHPATQQPHPITLITGRAASGKTSVIRAIAALKELVSGHGPPPDPARLRRRGSPTGKIAATWILSPAEAGVAGVPGPTLVTEVSLDDGPAPLFDPGVRALFSRHSMEVFPSRRWIPPARPTMSAPPSDLMDPRHRLSSDPRKYAGVRQAIIDLALGDAVRAAERLTERGVVARWEQADPLAAIKRSLAALAPGIRLTGVELHGPSPAVRFVRRDGVTLDLDDLSESEQDALIFAVMFDRIGIAGAIVAIDRPELHLPSDDQARFLRALGSLGEDNQIIAATGSEALVAAMEAPAVVRLP